MVAQAPSVWYPASHEKILAIGYVSKMFAVVRIEDPGSRDLQTIELCLETRSRDNMVNDAMTHNNPQKATLVHFDILRLVGRVSSSTIYIIVHLYCSICA